MIDMSYLAFSKIELLTTISPLYYVRMNKDTDFDWKYLKKSYFTFA